MNENLSVHAQVALLVPWYVNDTLDDVEKNLVASHIEQCETCRNEVHFLTHVEQAANSGQDVHAIPQNGLAKLLQRIDEVDVQERRRPSQLENLWARMHELFEGYWLRSRWVMTAVPAIALAVVVALMWNSSSIHEPAYQTLTNGQPGDQDAVKIHITLSDGADIMALQQIISPLTNAPVSVYASKGDGYFVELPADTGPDKVMYLLERLKENAAIDYAELKTD